VRTDDASCEHTPTITLADPFRRVGMGFSADATGTGETLFVAADPFRKNNQGLGRVDLTASQVVAVGPFAPTDQFAALSADLTGTGDGRLFGFFGEDPTTPGAPAYPTVGQVDPSSGAVQSPQTMWGVKQPIAWAFAFWGGHFYLFTTDYDGATDTTSCSVADYDPASGLVNAAYSTNIGFNVIGAGVSTCAPIQPTP
jgi:hypothetical protein